MTNAPNDAHRPQVPDVVCGVCQETLNRRRIMVGDTVESETWIHPFDAQKDHEPLPIPRAEAVDLVLYCDFCSSPHVAWQYTTTEEIHQLTALRNYTSEVERRPLGSAHRFETVSHKEGARTEIGESTYSDTWAACGVCAELIELRDVERLITHARRVNEQMTKLPRRLLRQHFGQFFQVIGPRVPYATKGEPA